MTIFSHFKPLHSDRQLHYSAFVPQQPPPFSFHQAPPRASDVPPHPLHHHHMPHHHHHHHHHSQNHMHLTLPIADNAPPPPPTQPTEPPVLDDVLDAYHDGLLSLTGMDDVYHTTGGAGGVAGGASASQLGKRPRAAVEPPAFALTVGDDADLMSLYERLGLHVPSSRDFDFSGVVGEPPLLTASGAPLLPTTIDRPFENAEENRLTIPIGFGPDPARLVPVNDRQYARIVKRRVQRASRLAALAVATGTADTSTTAASASLEAGRKKRAHDAARDKVGRFTDNFN